MIGRRFGKNTAHCRSDLNVPHFPYSASYNAYLRVGYEMGYQGVIGRPPPGLWLPPLGSVGLERLAALAANTLAWMIIIKLVVNA